MDKCECCNNIIIENTDFPALIKCDCGCKCNICYWCYMENGYKCKECQRDRKIRKLLSQ